MEPKEKILRTATHLFAKKSYAAVGIREIARAAEVNSAMISYYFGGKHGILKEIFRQFTETHRQIFCQAFERTSDIEGFYRVYLRQIILSFRDKGAMYAVCLSEFNNDIPEVRDLKTQFTEENIVLFANLAVKFQVDMSAFDFFKDAFGPLALLNSALGMLIMKKAYNDEQAPEELYEKHADLMIELMLHGMMGVIEAKPL